MRKKINIELNTELWNKFKEKCKKENKNPDDIINEELGIFLKSKGYL